MNFVTKIENEMMDEWFIKHVENKEKTEYRILIEPYVDVFGKEIVFELIESKGKIETEILGC